MVKVEVNSVIYLRTDGVVLKENVKHMGPPLYCHNSSDLESKCFLILECN
jgi:hypothetical protein